jgi:type IV fimbrial biogenesis protein FimT
MKAANPLHSFHACVRGFTLLELMTALAVLGILLGIGVPALSNMSRNSQIAAESANLVSALNLARSEAIRRGVRVSICPAADMESCVEDDADWSGGWLLFEDNYGDMGVLNDSDVLLQSWAAPANGVTVTSEAKFVTFSRQARAEFAGKFEVSKEGCSNSQKRQIDIDISGRVGLKRVDCG